MPVQKRIIYTSSLIAILLAFYCYNPFVLFFLSDDFIHIPLSAEGKFLQQNSFRPVCDLSVMLDYSLWGKQAWGYHLTNLFLHIIACILFFSFFKLLFKKYTTIENSNFICWLGTALFFIYAMHSEPVLWILGRSAILATIFSLLFLYCFIRRHDAIHFKIGVIVFWILCLLTYESTWILPCYALLISIIATKKKESSLRKEMPYYTLIIVIFVSYLLIRNNYIHEITGTYESGFLLSGDYILLEKHFILLLVRTFVPAFINNKIVLGLFILCTILFIWLFKKQENKSFVILLFVCLLISLLPYISLGVDTNGTESERFLYFPTLIVVIIFALIIANARQQKAYWLFTGLFAIHLAVLFPVKDNYVNAGAVNKQIAKALQTNADKKVIIAAEIPQAQNGALILRQGFPQMLRWLNDETPDTIITCSQRYELLPLQSPYKIILEDSLRFECGENNLIIRGSSDTLLLKFTDSALLISK